MGNSWFGSLELAYKYAIVFGGALLITLIAGGIKVILDKRKMNKFMKLADHEKQSGAQSDDAILNMREKDEGDLFGIRAIEAGFFGGVVQSASNSPSVSRRGSLSGSPAPSLRIPRGAYAGAPKILINQHYNNVAGSTMSASSSVLDLAQSRDSVGQSSIMSGQSLRHSRSTPSLLLENQQPVDSVFSVLAPAAYVPTSSASLQQPGQARFKNSQQHVSVYSMSGPPSPSATQACPYHGSQPNQGRASLGPGLPVQDHRQSTMSMQSSVWPEEWEESIYGEPARLVEGPEKRGKKTIEVGSINDVSADESGRRASVVSRVTLTSSYGGQPERARSKKHSPPPVPAMPLRLPAFSKNVVIGKTNPEFEKFKQQRLHIEPKEDDKIVEQVVERERIVSCFSDPETPTTPTSRKKRNHLSVISPRTSFSFEYANSENTHPEQRAFTAEPAPRILTRQTYARGAYTPAGRR